MLTKKEKIIFFLSLFIIALLTKTQGLENDYSRLATVESLVERNTFIIDDVSIVPKVDKVFINGHFYSDKPPVLSFLSAGVYFLLYRLFNISFSSNLKLTYYLMTLICIGILSSLMILFFYKSLKFIKIKETYRLILTFGLLFGTLILPYALIFNNHIVAASLLLISFYFILKIKFGEKKGRYLFIVGLLLSLAATIDLVSGGIFLILFFIYFIMFKDTKKKYLFLLAILIPLIIHFILNFTITGDLIPAHLHPEYFNYSGSEFSGQSLTGFFHHNSIWSFFVYSFHSLIGKGGLFLYNPVLIFSFIFLFNIVFQKKNQFKKEALIVFIGTTIIIAYYLIFSANYGGRCYGIRWFVTFIPLLFFFCGFIFTKKNKMYIYLFFITLIISSIFSLIGVIDPWEKLTTIIEIKKVQINYYLLH